MADDSCAKTEAVCFRDQSPTERSSFTLSPKRYSALSSFPCEPTAISLPPTTVLIWQLVFLSFINPLTPGNQKTPLGRRDFTISFPGLKEAGLPHPPKAQSWRSVSCQMKDSLEDSNYFSHPSFPFSSFCKIGSLIYDIPHIGISTAY